MQIYLSKLLGMLTTLERSYGFALSDPQERKILDFIIESVSNEKLPTAEEIVAVEIASRATTYRKLKNLIDCGLIKTEILDYSVVYSIGPRAHELGIVIRKIFSELPIRS